MKKYSISKKSVSAVLVALMFVLFPAVRAAGMTHVIKFGCTVGLAYLPDQLSVLVGDTLLWEGNFCFYPISSTLVPQGAESWHMSQGTRFKYAVRTAGQYTYQCDKFADTGMVGSFEAVESGMGRENPQPVPLISSLRLDNVSPNPVSGRGATVEFSLSEPQEIALNLFSMTGKQVVMFFKEKKSAGHYQYRVPASAMPSGVYLLRLEGKQTQMKLVQWIK